LPAIHLKNIINEFDVKIKLTTETIMIKVDEEDLKNISAKEIRVAVIGNVDSGKSTLVGVLTKCLLDDGRGLARQLVFNYSHEKGTGRTSSIAQEIMAFKEGVQVEPDKKNEKKIHCGINY